MKELAERISILIHTLSSDAGSAAVWAIVLVIVLCLVFFLTGMTIGRLRSNIHHASLIKFSRGDAVKRSRAVLGGLVGEQFAPFLPGFPCSAEDVRFVGKPVDFIAFSGMSQGEIEEVVFIEVKTGQSALSTRERQLKKAVEEGRVRYAEYRCPPSS